MKNGIIPKSLERIQNESLKDFILKCLRPEYERPNSIQLLNDPFLTSLGSEENNYPVNLIELPQEEFKISSKHRSTLSFIFPNEDELVPIISDKSLKSSSTSLYKNTMNSASKDSLTNFSTSNPISSKNKPPSRVISPFVSINPLSTSVSKTHKVSLKNSLNQGQGSFTKFEINIIENPTETIGDIVQIIFIVHKIKKRKINFNP